MGLTLLVGFVSWLTLASTFNFSPVQIPDIQLISHYKNPTAFNVSYPVSWQYQIPERGVFLLGERAVFEGQLGSVLTIQRQLPTREQRKLVDVLNEFLDLGPFHNRDSWEVVEDTAPTTLAGQQAFSITLEGSSAPDQPQFRIQIFVTQADSRPYYVIVSSTPRDAWQQYTPLLEAILQSVEFEE